jgi:hypothetical protein
MRWVQNKSHWCAVVNTAMNLGGNEFLDLVSDYFLLKECGQRDWLRWTVVNKIMNSRVPYKAGISLTS